jgi:hypothetical protein
MGLMSIEKTKLEIIQMTGSPCDAEAAKTIIPVLENHHLLLVRVYLRNPWKCYQYIIEFMQSFLL